MFASHALAVLISILPVAFAASRTSAPAGSIIVRAGTTASGEFPTLTRALNSITSTTSNVTIFMFPGTYVEQVNIVRTGPLTILGYTTDTTTYTANQVILSAGVPASTAGSDDASGTLRIHKNDFRMYNVNVKNTFGIGSQAIAISQYGSRVGLYACGFYGYQDTVYANVGTQVYLKGYIEGATDFIFGRQGSAYFGGNTIAVTAPGYITASGRQSNDSTSYVFNANKIVLASGASTSGNYYLGRPWDIWAKCVSRYRYYRFIFKNTQITAPINQALWSVWNTATPNTADILFADFNTTGVTIARASFATALTATQAALYSISSAVGSDYTTWVDAAYIV
ncbi:pectinesterase [Mycena floridula]|nr:pectinesterase [Mycena floridula]